MDNLKEKWNKTVKNIPKDKSPSRYAVDIEKTFKEQSHILDLGGSIGVDSLYFIGQGHTVELADISNEALSIAEESAQSQKIDEKLSVNELDLNDGILPYKDELFDYVYSRLALHYFDKTTTGKIFKEIERVLKTNGKAYLTLKSPADKEEIEYLLSSAKEIDTNLFDDNGSTKSRFSIKQLENILSESGVRNFKVSEIKEDLSGRVDNIKSGKIEFILNEVIITA